MMVDVPKEDGQPALRILIVEDDSDTLQSMAYILKTAGYEVQEAADGPQGLKFFEAQPHDVVLLDIGLPAMDGFEVARRIRAQNLVKRPLIVAVTGYGQPEDRRRSYDVGIDLHLVKPVDLDELRALLQRFEQLSRRVP